MRFELDFCSLVVLETKVTRAVTSQILEDNCVPADRSQDLMAITDVGVEIDTPESHDNNGGL
jgi:hypothetical protein